MNPGYLLLLAALGLLLLGAVGGFAWLCAMVARRVFRPAQPEAQLSHDAARIAALIRRTRKGAGLPPIN